MFFSIAVNLLVGAESCEGPRVGVLCWRCLQAVVCWARAGAVCWLCSAGQRLKGKGVGNGDPGVGVGA